MDVKQCPVCQGHGKVIDPFEGPDVSLSDKIRPCHGCSGRGYIQLYGPKDMEMMMKIPELKKLIIDNMKRELKKQQEDKDNDSG